ncbi:MAG: N-acetylmuramoyl-L-alanine amidase [Rickettsiales bacterium]|jgi:N-acetylmuramoyl-L-alanine amidase|nr:N-acetylmuramoyl-L-alanine amidase [Rickettsiales bacterium]
MKNIIILFFLGIVTYFILPFFSASASVLSIETDDSSETIILSLGDIGDYKAFMLPNPDRLVLDVVVASPPKSIALPKDYTKGLIKTVRSGRFDSQTNRYVFELHSKTKILKEQFDERASELIIELASPRSSRLASSKTKLAKPTKPPAKSKYVVIIDPGHGGQDPGAIGPKGTREKDIVLEYAKALQNRLIKSGKYKVVITREGDRFIALRDRVAIARKAGGDIFLSLHADSAPNDEARGLSVYTVSEKASDKEAEDLAARENKADIIAGIDLSGEREDVAGILISLAQRETKNNSATLADVLVVALNDKVRLLQNTHRFAGFAVLKAPDIPSVLIEIGFLSHPEEEKLLKTRSYREKVVSGIAEGIDKYFEKLPMGKP